EDRQIELCSWIALISCESEPFDRFSGIARDPDCFVVNRAKIVERFHLSALCRDFQPFARSWKVFADTGAIEVQVAEERSRLRIPFLGGWCQQFECLVTAFRTNCRSRFGHNLRRWRGEAQAGQKLLAEVGKLKALSCCSAFPEAQTYHDIRP